MEVLQEKENLKPRISESISIFRVCSFGDNKLASCKEKCAYATHLSDSLSFIFLSSEKYPTLLFSILLYTFAAVIRHVAYTAAVIMQNRTEEKTR